MIIKLITEDFKGSSYSSSTNCPLAKALKRLLPDKQFIVLGLSVYLNDFRDRFMFNLLLWNSITVQKLIDKANNGEEVCYELDIPELNEFN
jgi:hypothetical protein